MRADGEPEYLWLNGEIVDSTAASLSHFNHSLHYGFAVFEGIRSYRSPSKTSVFRGEEHVARLFRSAEMLGIRIGRSRSDVIDACSRMLGLNGIQEGYIRPIVYIGDGLAGLKDESLDTNVAVLAWPWRSPLPAQERGITLCVSSYRKPQPGSFPLQAKASGNYLLAKIAYLEARRLGFDDALLLDSKGFVSEATSQNIFAVSSGELITPGTGSCLEGITRSAVIELARGGGMAVHERPLSPAELHLADEIFLCSTAAEIMPVIRLNETIVGEGRPGPMTRELLERYSKLVRTDSAPARTPLAELRRVCT